MEQNNIISLENRAILVGLAVGDQNFDSDDESLDELAELLMTLGYSSSAKVLQRRTSPDPRYLIGEGKTAEIRELAKKLSVNLVVFDNELSPSQLSSLSDALDLRVTDRSGVILEIFADRASSSEGRLQVELARLKYLLPRLSGHGVDLSRMGGQLRARGPGETKLETDRRHIRERITHLESSLKDVKRVRTVQRARRIKNSIPVVALVGYTNAGKSTLAGALTGADIQANNRLFDTLDTTTRKFEVDPFITALLSDTVGFIRRLPTHLIDAFRATLEELSYSDLLLHVIDVSVDDWEARASVVEETLVSLGVEKTPAIHVYNKSDLRPDFQTDFDTQGVLISSVTGSGLDALRERIASALLEKKHRVDLEIPYAHSSLLDALYNESDVHKVDYLDEHILVNATCSKTTLDRLDGNVRVNLNGV